MSEEILVRELARHADGVHPAHLRFEDVRASAHRIRRHRRVAASGAAAAVVAAVLVAPTLLGGSPRSQEPVPAPPPPAVSPAVLHDGQVDLPDGRAVEVGLANEDVTQLGVLADGRIVAATSRPYGVQVFAPTGERIARYRVDSNAITMSADDTLAAWVDDNLRVVVLESGVPEPTTYDWGIPLPGESSGSVDAVFGSDCAHDGCTVLGGDFSTTTTRLERRSEPGADLETSEPMRITDVSPDGERWAVGFQPGDDEQFGCSGIYEAETGQVLARSCETSGLRFAPDGHHLLGMRGDNAMFGQVEVYDQDLQQVTVFEPPGKRVVKGATWADESHLLVVTVGLGATPDWTLLRVPIDGGEPETLVGPVDGPNAEMWSPFLLSE
ncbi:hypothetical protein [Nocardioides halotolerans]|uniref:hypothetical protein n=1 Tax=Nocardioides halotolerans TaxID=433660 RepID=UPI00041F06E6|nr:hypothetical protein [Nocardioides halotolerans]